MLVAWRRWLKKSRAERCGRFKSIQTQNFDWKKCLRTQSVDVLKALQF